MPRSMPVLATADEIRRIARNAEELIDAVYSRDEDEEDDEGPDTSRRSGERVEAAIEAFRFCARAAGELGDPELMPVITAAIDACARFDDHPDDTPSTLGTGLTLLLQAGAPVDEEIKRLAGYRDARVREAVAQGLRPRGEPEIALLEVLSTDAIAQVRNVAKQTLSTVREVAWWKGKFASDPVARLSAEEAERHKAALEQISKLLDTPRYALDKHEKELVELASTLPDALAIELAELVLSTPDPYGLRLTAMGTMMLERAGGTAAFLRVCEALSTRSARHFLADQTAQMVLHLPRELRVAACKELTTYAINLPDEVRHKHTDSPAWTIAETVAKAWPPGEDLTPLLDAVLTLPPREGHELDWVVSGLDDVFTKEGADPTPILERVLEARLAGFPGAWKNIRAAIDTMLERVAGPLLRSAAERAILGEDKDNIRWGMEKLLLRAHDPSRDPGPAELVARFYAEPRYRKVIHESHVLQRLAAPLLRADLRAGRLSFVEASTALVVIGGLYGGIAESTFLPRRLREPEEVEKERQAKLAEVEAFLGPPELRGPPTEEEWRTLRAARAEYMESDEQKGMELFKALPQGPWAPEDRAALDVALERLRTEDSDLGVPIALALMAKPDDADMPLFEELIDGSDPSARSLIRSCWRQAAEALGISPAALGKRGEAGDDDDWDDDEDEGEGDEWDDDEDDA